MSQRFFVSCQIGLEELLEQELHEVFPWLLDLDFRPQTSGFQLLEKAKGGIEIETEFHLGLQLNYFLKVASRILLRLEKRDRIQEFFQLERSLKAIGLKKHLGSKPFSIQVDCSQSRLGQEKKVQATVEKALESQGLIPTPEPSQKVLVRIHKDQLSVSLDTSGEHLHFRGYRKFQGIAPLRESLAAAALMLLRGDRSLGSLQHGELLDPMCGSGTLLLEAAQLYQPNFNRGYAFESWTQLPVLLQKYPRKKMNVAGLPFQRFIGLDHDPQVLELAKKNVSEDFPSMDWLVQDFFSFQRDPSLESELWVVSNPPYHERIKADFSMEDYVKKLQSLKPRRLALVLSEKQAAGFRKLWPGLSDISTDNGGLSIRIIFSSTDLQW